ncbi:MAG: hypothetical protein RL660_2601 [Bacteroidota bacterium]|jgi:putative membrane protein
MPKLSKIHIALAICLIVHAGGLWGMTCYNLELFASATPLNLLLCLGLLFYTHEGKNKAFYIFCAVCFITGFTVEWIGVNTSYLFGKYNYLPAMGPQLGGVPLVIGVNWIIMMLCCGITMHHIMQFAMRHASEKMRKFYTHYALPIDAALLATLADVVLEPAAISLKFWAWQYPDGQPPLYNYVCWFVISLCIMLLFNALHFNKHNKFAIHLLWIQVLFFVLINTLL